MVTTHITRRLNSVAWKSFSPLGVGAGAGSSCSKKRWYGSILGVGAGAWGPSMTPRSIAHVSFQSPRRWGGVGLAARPLVSIFGGIRKVISLQSPRRWRGIGLASTTFNASRIISPSFNPLGGGAGSGSQHMQKAMEQISASGFQSPRRWGGVGLIHLASPAQRLLAWFQSPRRWGGVGLAGSCVVSIPSEVGRGRARSASQLRHAHAVCSFQSPRRWGGVGLGRCTGKGNRLPKSRFNPLGGGAGSGSTSIASRAWRSIGGFNPLGGGAGSGSKPTGAAMVKTEASFNPLGGGAGSGSSSIFPRAMCLPGFQSPRRWGGVGLRTRGPSVHRDGPAAFQSPRRWGGVGLQRAGEIPSLPDNQKFQSPRRWGGVGLSAYSSFQSGIVP